MLVAVALIVVTAVASVVNANTLPRHNSCHYPEHAKPTECHSRWDDCCFVCKDGFEAWPPSNPSQCICKAPSRVCNGVCGHFPGHLCPSGKPGKPWKRDDVAKRAVCDSGLTACGVWGWEAAGSSAAWDCVDTATDLESCGGCMVPFGHTPARGVDCTALLGVMDVACSAGSCIVKKCLPGYKPSTDHSTCVPAGGRLQVEGDVLASDYGLEHVPLKRDPAT